MTQLRRAACDDVNNTDVFFPAPGDAAAEAIAKQICAPCSMRRECLALAMRTAHLDGIWGGFTAAERAIAVRHRSHSTREP